MNPEDFTVYADALGTAMLCCEVPRCYWEQEIGGMGIDHDLGTLLSTARSHLAAKHPERPPETVVPPA